MTRKKGQIKTDLMLGDQSKAVRGEGWRDGYNIELFQNKRVVRKPRGWCPRKLQEAGGPGCRRAAKEGEGGVKKSTEMF